jgi:ribosomal protein S18 acetylase RimI-like enzyme
MGVAIRAGTLSDIRALVRMHAECSPETIERRYLSPMPVLGPRLAARLLSPVDGFSLLGERAHQVVGISTVARYDDDPSTGEVGLLVVDPCQRQGVGTALLMSAAREAARRSFGALLLTVHPHNRAVLSMVNATGLRAHVSTHDGFTQVAVSLGRSAPSPVGRAPGATPSRARLHSTEPSANN